MTGYRPYSTPNVGTTRERRPPSLSATSAFATSTIPEPVLNLIPTAPSITSSRVFGMLVRSMIR